MNDDVKDTTMSQVEEVTTEIVTEPGEKTDPALLLKSLHEEREIIKLKEEENVRLKEELQTLQNQPTEAFSDEGKMLQGQIVSLKEEIALKDAREQYPALKDKASEFEQFRKDYPGVDMGKVAKLFLAENDMLEVSIPRKGLERSSGGVRVPTPQGWTPEAIDELRVNNFRAYKAKLQSGEFNRK